MFYSEHMESPGTVSITLPPDLLQKTAERAQREQRTMNEIVGQALQRYLSRDPRWEEILCSTRAAGRRLGITSEADVERLSDDFRRERQRRFAL